MKRTLIALFALLACLSLLADIMPSAYARQTYNPRITLLARNAVLHGSIYYEHDYCVAGWHDPNDYVTWNVRVPHTGRYRVEVFYACTCPDGVFTVGIDGDNTVSGVTRNTGSWENYIKVDLGELDLPAGRHDLAVRAAKINNFLMNLHAVYLIAE